MTTRSEHLLSPDARSYWDGVAQSWRPVEHPAQPPATRDKAPKAELRGLQSFAGEVRSENLADGQTVLVWARWILIGTGLLLSFWSPADLLTLQVQLAAIIALAFGNFYLHVQLLRGHPALDNVVYAASLADIAVVTALVIVQGGYVSPVFIFYSAAVVGISVAFPTWMTAAYTGLVVGMYGVIAASTAPADDYPAIFTRLLMIAAIAVCGNVFARHESRRRTDAVRVHDEVLDDIEQGAAAKSSPPSQPQPATQAS